MHISMRMQHNVLRKQKETRFLLNFLIDFYANIMAQHAISFSHFSKSKHILPWVEKMLLF